MSPNSGTTTVKLFLVAGRLGDHKFGNQHNLQYCVRLLPAMKIKIATRNRRSFLTIINWDGE